MSAHSDLYQLKLLGAQTVCLSRDSQAERIQTLPSCRQ